MLYLICLSDLATDPHTLQYVAPVPVLPQHRAVVTPCLSDLAIVQHPAVIPAAYSSHQATTVQLSCHRVHKGRVSCLTGLATETRSTRVLSIICSRQDTKYMCPVYHPQPSRHKVHHHVSSLSSPAIETQSTRVLSIIPSHRDAKCMCPSCLASLVTETPYMCPVCLAWP